jgi:hypothetical protein
VAAVAGGANNQLATEAQGAELAARGIRAGKERVRRMMKSLGLQARGKRRFKATTNSAHDLPIAPNLLARNFTVDAPNKVWTGDITYIWTDEGWLYLAVVIDLFNRQVVGFAMGERMTRTLVMDAFSIAACVNRRALSSVASSAGSCDRDLAPDNRRKFSFSFCRFGGCAARGSCFSPGSAHGRPMMG